MGISWGFPSLNQLLENRAPRNIPASINRQYNIHWPMFSSCCSRGRGYLGTLAYPSLASALISLSELAEAGGTSWSLSAKCTRRNGGWFQNCHGWGDVGGREVPASRLGDARRGAFSSCSGVEAVNGGIAGAGEAGGAGGNGRQYGPVWASMGQPTEDDYSKAVGSASSGHGRSAISAPVTPRGGSVNLIPS